MPGNRINRTIFTLVFALMLCPSASMAAPPSNKGKGRAQDLEVNLGLSATVSAGVSVNAGITVGDARRLATRYELTGAKPLPPGIAKNLARGKPVPPGIARTRLPEAFIYDLPHHEGYEWQRVGRDLVLVAVGTLIVVEILERVFD